MKFTVTSLLIRIKITSMRDVFTNENLILNESLMSMDMVKKHKQICSIPKMQEKLFFFWIMLLILLWWTQKFTQLTVTILLTCWKKIVWNFMLHSSFMIKKIDEINFVSIICLNTCPWCVSLLLYTFWYL